MWADLVEFNTNIRWLVGALLVLCYIFSLESIAGYLVLYLLLCGAGALVSLVLGFDPASGAALVGMIMQGAFVVFLFFMIIAMMDWIYRLVSLPGLIINRIQWFLDAPWRYLVREDWYSDNTKAHLRKWLPIILGIPCYILGFAVRPIGAVYYNIIVKIPMEFYNYFMEVINPKSKNEGAGNFFKWILYLPYRIGYYLFWHGCLTVVECIAFTVFDTFVPTLTMFHGTDLSVSDKITAAPDRNQYRINNATWRSGIWNVGTAFWGGHGIYFAISRSLAYAYSDRAQSNAVIISRVTLGKVLPLALMPTSIYIQTGEGGAHHQITSFAFKNGYTAGEWWNYRNWGKAWGPRKGNPVWEYCLFDWKNAYNYPWRIRPLYVHNKDNGGIQRIAGGMTHWFFRKNLLFM